MITDRARYASVPSMIISYVDYPILDIHLLLSPVEKNAFRDAIILPSVFPEAGTSKGAEVRMSDGIGGDIAWDRTWPVTKPFRVWWRRVVDPVVFARASDYDPYTTRASQPGTAWCEAIVSLSKPLPLTPGHFILHFFPDGHVEADISAKRHDPSQDPPFRPLDHAEEPRLVKHEQGLTKTLNGMACIKEIPNPYFGLHRPSKTD